MRCFVLVCTADWQLSALFLTTRGCVVEENRLRPLSISTDIPYDKCCTLDNTSTISMMLPEVMLCIISVLYFWLRHQNSTHTKGKVTR